MRENDNNSRLYLNIPAIAPDEIGAIDQLLEQMTTSLDIACITLTLDDNHARNGSTEHRQQQQLIARLQKKNIAVLANLAQNSYQENRKSFEKALENALATGVDGAHMKADELLYLRAREVLGQDVIIGCDCGVSRHRAMLLGEIGADYVAFRSPSENSENSTQVIDLINWWQELFEVPCMASDVVDQTQIESLLQIPADFIGIGPSYWPEFSSNTELLSWLSHKCPLLVEAS